MLTAAPASAAAQNTFLRYRRRVASEGFSVSQTISLPLLRDYMAANGMIYDAAAEALKLPTQGVDREAYLERCCIKRPMC